MKGFRWEHPYWLWLLCLLPILILAWYFYRRAFQRQLQALAEPRLMAWLLPAYRPKNWWWKQLLPILAFGMGVIALANPQYPTDEPAPARKGVDVLMALDCSKSMLATDVQPSRLEKAKAFMLSYLEARPNDRVGLLLFAGNAYLQMPLSNDLAAMRMYVQSAQPDAIPLPGTNLSAVFEKGLQVYAGIDDRYKTLILITDGENHEPEALVGAKKLAAAGVVIHTIGVGNASGIALMDPAANDFKKDRSGKTVVTALHESLLQQIANAGQGSYLRLINPDKDAASIAADLTQFEQGGKKGPTRKRFATLFFIPLAICLLLLIWEPWIRLHKNLSWLLLLFIAGQANAQSSGDLIRKGNVFYQQQQWLDAEKCYHQALEKSPRHPIALFNQGNAWYRAQSFDRAVQSFDKIIAAKPNRETVQKAWYNKGLAHVKQNQLPEAILAFKEGLKLNPADKQARENLQKALEANKKQSEPEQKKSNKPSPKPTESPKMSKEQIAQQLEALRQKETALQKKLQQQKGNPTKPEKDW
jgi:tetratricopeptide (TPR) repeat protein